MWLVIVIQKIAVAAIFAGAILVLPLMFLFGITESAVAGLLLYGSVALVVGGWWTLVYIWSAHPPQPADDEAEDEPDDDDDDEPGFDPEA